MLDQQSYDRISKFKSTVLSHPTLAPQARPVNFELLAELLVWYPGKIIVWRVYYFNVKKYKYLGFWRIFLNFARSSALAELVSRRTARSEGGGAVPGVLGPGAHAGVRGLVDWSWGQRSQSAPHCPVSPGTWVCGLPELTLWMFLTSLGAELFGWKVCVLNCILGVHYLVPEVVVPAVWEVIEYYSFLETYV